VKHKFKHSLSHVPSYKNEQNEYAERKVSWVEKYAATVVTCKKQQDYQE
jgi:hypothetical protein